MSVSIHSQQLVTFCKATADALRVDILRALSMESFGVLELCHIFEMPQPGMSHHLKILTSAGLLSTRREGNSIFYRRALISSGDSLEPLTTSFFSAINQITLDERTESRITEIHEQRAQRSKLFFEKNAHRFKENQDLIADLSVYASGIEDLLTNEDLPGSAVAIEVGPGSSELINLLAARFDQLYALDNTEEMLNAARSTLLPRYQGSVQFILGDLKQAFDTGVVADLVILNMVLHHIASPRQVFESVSQNLEPDGRILIVDLCPHDQDWAREACGDLWLGFEPSDLDKWANESNLQVGQSTYLGLKNGFQIQIRMFRKPG